jgi:hypothetical protein
MFRFKAKTNEQTKHRQLVINIKVEILSTIILLTDIVWKIEIRVLVVKEEDLVIVEALTLVTTVIEDMEEEGAEVLVAQGHSDPRQSK